MRSHPSSSRSNMLADRTFVKSVIIYWESILVLNAKLRHAVCNVHGNTRRLRIALVSDSPPSMCQKTKSTLRL
jgi:hypothetical protein